ncbi:ABC transporter permease subunit [Pikeienuella piscinae]|uniref:ABC transporter permease subunit n=1 Tax=Pikeienuella piscinae TaxID=2748098 RepID=A0A7L5C2I7_9RHOB|nr:ABC transporter permease subunit [Pikeienuella piscinae]QIE56756.1 ABC transporter permease subunit [Pikeienuella piscinae]
MATLRQTIGATAGDGAPTGHAMRVLKAWLPSADPLGLVGIVLAVVIWWALGFVVGSAVLPSPHAVMARVGQDFWVAPMLSYYGLPKTGLFDSLTYSATNVFLSVLLGGAIGVVLGLFTARVTLARAILDPILTTVGTIPILVLAPFFLIWFGTGRWSALLLITIYVVVILYIYAQRAADNLDPVYEDSARTLGAGGWDILWGMLIPGTLPQILGGLRIALAGAWGLEAIAELLGAQRGIGKIIEVLAGSLDTEGIFACLLVLGVAAVISDMLMGALARRAMRWSADAK